jgi:hypothetical protein
MLLSVPVPTLKTPVAGVDPASPVTIARIGCVS